MNQSNVQDLPTYKGNKMISILYLITADKARVVQQPSPDSDLPQGLYIEVPQDTNVLLFSDMPNRIACPIKGGIEAFANVFSETDFSVDPPNVTFAGTLESSGTETYSVFVMGTPIISGISVFLPVIEAVGQESLPPEGVYANVSLVVDSWIGTLGEALGALVAGTGALAFCTAGEVATLGSDSAACLGLAAATFGLGGSAINDGISTAQSGDN